MASPSASTDLADFEAVFPSILEQVVRVLSTKYEMPEEVTSWITRAMEYNVRGGKMTRGLTVVHTVARVKGERVTEQDLYEARVLGWCVELLQAYLLVLDDVMDKSHTRRGQPCWFRVPDVGLNAVNDGLVIQATISLLLKEHFGDRRDLYCNLMEMFNEVQLQTDLGQLCDMRAQPTPGVIELERFTLERYLRIVRYKTAFYSFYVPVALGLQLSGVQDPAVFERARTVCLKLGTYFQVQDDVLDCYGEPAVIGKIGTDIQDAKCSWLVVQALQRATDEQREVLRAHYGHEDDASVAAVKAVYETLGLRDVFADFEQASYTDIKALLDAEPDASLRSVLVFLLHKIYKRSK